MLEVVPEHPAARQARGRAWQQIAAISPSAAWPFAGRRPAGAGRPRPGPPGLNPHPRPRRAVCLNATLRNGAAGLPPRGPWPAAGEPGPQGRFLLWVDAVGGYLVCLDDQIILGRAGHDSHADVPLMGDLSRNHATLVRDGDGYILCARQPTFLNGQPSRRPPRFTTAT